MSTTDKRLLTIEEAAASVGYHPSTLRRAIHTTDPSSFPPPLKAKKPGGTYRIRSADLDAWVDSLDDA